MYVCIYLFTVCVCKALRREPHLLAVLNFDEDDEEDIMLSLIGSKHTGRHCIVL
jgi:hypothetical protein